MESSSRINLTQHQWSMLRKASQGMKIPHHSATKLQRLGLLQPDLIDGRLRLTGDGRRQLGLTGE